jgi:sec-independent protein translocase protein TatB
MSKLEPASARADLQPGWTGGGLEVATAGIEPTKEAAVTAGTAIGDAVSSLETEAQKDSARADLQEGLGPEFRDFDLNDLNPRNFVRKHLWDELEEDEAGRGGKALGEAHDVALLSPGESPPYDVEAT